MAATAYKERVEFGVLGPVEVRSEGRTWSVGSGRERFVLATLLWSDGRMTAADNLIEALWKQPPASAKSQLHNMISNLRRRLREASGGADLIATRAQGYELRVDAHRLDVTTFRELVAHGQRATQDGDHARALSVFTRALALWRGPALADVPDDLGVGIRETLHDERLAASEARLDAALALGHHDEVLRHTTALLAEQPYREHLYWRRMLALTGLGRRAEALATYRQAYRRLVSDLGVEPGPALRDLEGRILRGDSPAAIVATTANRAPTPRQLPPTIASLTGRDPLLDQITGELRRGDGPAPVTVVLVGPGGIGKTTLALAAAHQLADSFPDGQLYADLRGSHDNPADPHAVAGRILRTLGVDGSRLPEDPDERIATYRSHLAGRRILVVLDDAAGEAQVRPLLPGAAPCGVLVTSRRQLAALVDAARFTVPVLPPADAVALLTHGARPERVAAEPEAAAAIVAACGRLPLAVCIAAARLAVRPDWTLAEFRQRLARERHRLDELAVGDLDVRASIGLSYRSLPPATQALLRRLGLVAAPDWPAWVADALAGPDQPAQLLLSQLTDVHLVEPLGIDAVGQARYQLHDLVADFAAERAQAEDAPADRDAAVTRLLDGWLALATVADELVEHGMIMARGLAAPPPPADAARYAREAPCDWFEIERASLIAAVDQARQAAKAELAGSLALRISGFLAMRAYDDDRERMLQDVTTCVRDHGVDHVLARLLSALHVAYAHRSRNRELVPVAEEQLTLARRLGDREQEIRALINGSLGMRRQGRLAEATDLIDQAIAMCGPDTPRLLANRALVGRCHLHWERGRPDLAVAPAEQALAIQREEPNLRATAITLSLYGHVLADSGRLDEATQAYTECVSIANGLGDELTVTAAEEVFAKIEIQQRRWDAAADRLRRILAVYERAENQKLGAEILRMLGAVANAQGRPADAFAPLRRSLAIYRQLDQPLDVARALAHLDRAAAATGDDVAAAAYRRQYRDILTTLDLDDACLHLP